jgi:hypothetical protein
MGIRPFELFHGAGDGDGLGAIETVHRVVRVG